MRITADISLYPLTGDFTTGIKAFILDLCREPGLEIVTNQLSTQVRGEFDAVTGAINRCMRESMARPEATVLVVKYVNADLPIGTTPAI
jgi:uncharacterized protein YqgV (UPF0045/DUF77 family)